MATTRTPFICARCTQSISQQSRTFASAASASRRLANVKGTSAPSEDLPRWKTVPQAMRMNFRLRPLPQNQPRWTVNDSEELVDKAYDRFVGERAGSGAAGQKGMEGRGTRGSELLDEEIKWLALTHKSYEHGACGFNDRLAYLGRRILEVQTSLALLDSAPTPNLTPLAVLEGEVFEHPALDGLENITPGGRQLVLNKAKLARLAYKYELDKVIRWKPRKSDRLEISGAETVLAQTVYAIIGALALQRGGEVAARVAKERVLAPLGLKSSRT